MANLGSASEYYSNLIEVITLLAKKLSEKHIFGILLLLSSKSANKSFKKLVKKSAIKIFKLSVKKSVKNFKMIY